MSLEPEGAPSPAASTMEVKSSLPPGGGLELAQLEAFARNVDAELGGAPAPGQPGQAAPPPPPIPLERELAGMLELAGVAAGQFLPSVPKVLDEAACKQLGDALAPVIRKYGLERYLTGFAWHVELRALMVAGPILWALIAAVRADIAIAKAAARAPAARSELGAEIPATAPAPAPQASPPAQMLKPIDVATEASAA